MDVRVLGPLELWGDRGPVELRRGRPRRLLLALVVRAGDPVGAETLIDELWTDQAPQNAGNALQVLVSYLRRTLAEADDGPRIETTAAGYRLLLSRAELDAGRFEDHIAEASRATDPEARLARLDEALSWWRGAPLTEAAYDDFAAGTVAHLNELRVSALDLRIETRLALGHHREVVAELRQLVTEHPLHERFHGQLMLALYRCDRQADALRAYEAARTLLAEELGLEPGPELRALERSVLDHAEHLAPPTIAAGDAVSTRATGTTGAPGGTGVGTVTRDGSDQAGEPSRADGPDGPPTAAGPAPAPGPAPGRALHGRDEAVARLRHLVADHRLVTLTGTGGAGKTRLAQAVVDGLAHAGTTVWWADLAPVRDEAGVVSTIASAVGAATRPDDTAAAEVIAQQLGARTGVLVLDTCEHVVDLVRPIVARLVEACPGVSILATSRQPVRAAGELAWPVPPLALPDPLQLDESIASCPSVQLFCERAARVRPDFAFDESTAPAIGRICLLLDGVPLAIELAAAQTALLRPEKLVRLLDDRLRVLVDGPGVARQQTLRATIDWSYELLDDDEARFLDRLSVFAGSFDVEAAVVVAGEGLQRDGLELLLSLSRQSLVSVTDGDRFRLLDTVRAYAAERLDHDEAEATRRRRARWCAELIVEADRHLRGPDALGWMEAVRLELPELRASIDWAFAGADPVLGARLAGATSWFLGMEGLFADGRRWLEQAAAVEGLDDAARAAVLIGQADHSASLGGLEQALAQAEASAALHERLGDQLGLARSLLYHGVSLWGLGRLDEAAETQDRMAALYRALGDDWGFGLALLLRCRTGVDLDEDDVEERLDAALALARRGGDPHIVGLCLEQRARVALHNGDVDLAVDLGLRSLEHNELVGYTEGVTASLHALGAALAAAGRPDDARARHQQAMALAIDLDHPGAMAEGLERLALLDVENDPARALAYLTAADALRERRAVPRPRSYERSVEPARDAVTGRLADDDAARAVRSGRLLDVRDVITA